MFANRIAQTVIAFVLTFTTVFTVMSPSATACGIESPQRVSQCVRMVNTSLDAIEREGKKVRHLRDSLLEQARHARDLARPQAFRTSFRRPSQSLLKALREGPAARTSPEESNAVRLL